MQDDKPQSSLLMQMLTQNRSLALSVKCKTIQILEVNIGENLPDFEFDQFSDITAKAQSIKEKNDRLNFIKYSPEK